MGTFVLVHGGWGGGWQWAQVAHRLRAAGHSVTTPTLTGLGERAHVRVDVSLATHIDDLAEHLWFENLTDVVLVGWSYGAVPVEGVADRMPERLRAVVSLDGLTVCDGEVVDTFRDVAPEQARRWKQLGVMDPPTSEELADVLHDPDLRAFVGERERPHPTATLTDRFPDTGGQRWQVPHVYLACPELPQGESVADAEQAVRAELMADPRWEYRVLALNHLGLLYAPEVVAEALLDLLYRFGDQPVRN